MELALGACTIRPFRRGDEESLVANANDRSIWRNLRDRFPHPYHLGDAAWWIANAGPTHFAIDIGGHACGGIGFDREDDVFARSAEIGYWLGKPHWGKGIASLALGALTEHVFATTDLVRLHAGVFAWNPASARVLEKSGYVLEGRARDAVWKDGELTDELVYAKVKAR
jgi:[ribosomal protein S5]-alanine N-acetyltransferase